MKRILQLLRWRKWKLTSKLLLFYIPLIVLPIILGMYFVTSQYHEASRRQLTESIEGYLNLMVEKADQRFGRIEEFSMKFFVDPEILNLMQTIPGNYYERVMHRKAIEQRINFLLRGSERPYILGCNLITPYGAYTVGADEPMDRPQDLNFLREVRASEGRVVWEWERSYEADQVFRMGRMINQVRGSELRTLGLLVFVIDPEAMTSIWHEDPMHSDSVYRLYEEGELILRQGDNPNSDQKQGLVLPAKSERYGWTLEAAVPLEYLNQTMKESTRFSLFVTLACVLVGLLMTHLIAIDIVIPVRKLMWNMKQGIKGIKPQNLRRFNGAREVTELNDTFISVLYEINELNRDVIETQKKKQKAEIRIIQKQLSPHFLYNTLNSIRWMAIIQKQDNIKEMVDSLTNLLTYSIRDLNNPVLLIEEISILKDYVKIQKVRYQNFTLITNIPDNLSRLGILKFLLQPIIENALIHGLSKVNRSGEIRVVAFVQNAALHVELSDNGCGISPPQLESIRKLLSSDIEETHHLGLKSIHELIQLNYGQKYGVSLESKENVGTVVQLMLPIIHIEAREGRNIENRYDCG